MSELKREELLEYLDDMRKLWKMERLPLIDYQPKEEEQAYQQIKALIQKPGVTEEFIEEKATELYNYLYYETFSLDQVKDFVHSLFEEIQCEI